MQREAAYLATVVIPTYNRASLLRQTLTSLTAQTLSSDAFQVIVVDDGSTDDSFEVLREFTHQLSLVSVYQPDQGFRAARARNLGIKLAEGELCIFVDSGALASATLVQNHIAAHDRMDMAVIGYAHGLDFTDAFPRAISFPPIDPLRVDSSIEQLTASLGYRDMRHELFETYPADCVLPAPWVYFWSCNVSVRTNALRSLGGFDENFTSWGVEDCELGFRLFQSGHNLVFRKAPAVVHLPHERDPNDMRRSCSANKKYLKDKHACLETEIFYAEHDEFLVNDRIREAIGKVVY